MAKPTNVQEVPLKDKILLTPYEAAAYFGIGVNRIAAMLREPNCKFVCYIGTHKVVNREKFTEFINTTRVV